MPVDRKDRTECAQVIESLLSVGELVLLAPDRCIEKSVSPLRSRACEGVVQTRDTLALGEFRDVLGTSRDHALLLLEYLRPARDSSREGDVRRAGAHFGEL
ncbi:MAG: SelB C-terminal domain-containing protein [Oscillospiraceae bacterium]